MSDELALLAAILAQPDEDTPRLVFADWLDENGYPERAEFVRLQIELARRPESEHRSPGYRALLARFRGLVAGHAEAWSAALGVPRTRAIFRRGFVEDVELFPNELPAPDNPALAREPLTNVRVAPPRRSSRNSTAGGPVLKKLAAWPGRGRLRALDLTGFVVPTPALAQFLKSPAAAELRALEVPNGLAADGVRAFARAPRPLRLERLNLGNMWLTADQARELADTPNLPHLRHLDLYALTGGGEDVGLPDLSDAIDALRARFGDGVRSARW